MTDLITPDKPPAGYDWKLRGVADNITTTSTRAIAWFHMLPVPWPYRTGKQQAVDIDAVVRAYTFLMSRQVHQRVSPKPFPISSSLRDLDRDTPNPIDPVAWADYLETKKHTLRHSSIGEPSTMIGVEMAPRSVWDRVTSVRNITKERPYDVAEREARRLRAEADAIGQMIEAVAEPMHQRDVEWLLWRSRALCLPIPQATFAAGTQPMDVYDLAGVYDSVTIDPQGSDRVFGNTLRIVGSASSHPEPVERHVAVLSVGRGDAQHVPGRHHPWLALALQVPGVEVSAHFDIVPGDKMAKTMQRKIDSIVDNAKQWRVHGEPGPNALPRLLAQARELQDVMTEGHVEDSTSVDGYWRIAIAGRTPDEANKRARKLIERMAQQRITLERPRAQEELYREFTPGEKVTVTVNRRRGPLRMAAIAMPQVSASVGHSSGMHVGDTVGITTAPCMWDFFRGMEREDFSGLTPVIGGLGSGKSYFMGGTFAISVLRNAVGTGLDPSGRMASIASWGPIAGRTKVMNLLKTEQGPYGAIADPTRDQCRQDPDVVSLPIEQQAEAAEQLYQDRLITVPLERKALAKDTLLAMLHPSTRRLPSTLPIIMEAIAEVGGNYYTSSLNSVLAVIRKRGEAGDSDAKMLWIALSEATEHPHGRIMMGAQRRGQLDDFTTASGLIVTLAGIKLPDWSANDQDMWSTTERLAVPLLTLAAHYVTRRVYHLPPTVQKVVTMDEAHFLGSWPSGRTLLASLERDSRKHNARVFTASQDARTALLSQDASKTLVSDAVILHTEDPEEQRAAAELLRIDPSFGSQFGRLRPPRDDRRTEEQKWRDAIVRISGDVGRVRLNGFHDIPELRKLLITSPKPRTERDLVDATSGAEW